jgi:hypothetical protein
MGEPRKIILFPVGFVAEAINIDPIIWIIASPAL